MIFIYIVSVFTIIVFRSSDISLSILPYKAIPPLQFPSSSYTLYCLGKLFLSVICQLLSSFGSFNIEASWFRYYISIYFKFLPLRRRKSMSKFLGNFVVLLIKFRYATGLLQVKMNRYIKIFFCFFFLFHRPR